MKRALDTRGRELARIHCLRKELDLDEDQYRVVLHLVGNGVDSAKDLDAAGRASVIRHLQAHVTKARKPRRYPGRPHNTDATARAELTKIEALLTDAGKPWSYAEGIMRRVTYGRKQKLEFCDPGELKAIIAALERNALKRLHAECEALWGAHWTEYAAHYAALLIDYPAVRRDIARHSQALSTVLRWWNGTVQIACVWPVSHDTPAGSCRCCRLRAGLLA